MSISKRWSVGQKTDSMTWDFWNYHLKDSPVVHTTQQKPGWGKPTDTLRHSGSLDIRYSVNRRHLLRLSHRSFAALRTFSIIVTIFLLQACLRSLRISHHGIPDKATRATAGRKLSAGRGYIGGDQGNSGCWNTPSSSAGDTPPVPHQIYQQMLAPGLSQHNFFNVRASTIPLLTSQQMAVLPRTDRSQFTFDSDDDIDESVVRNYIIHNPVTGFIPPLPELSEEDLNLLVPSPDRDAILGPRSGVGGVARHTYMHSSGLTAPCGLPPRSMFAPTYQLQPPQIKGNPSVRAPLQRQDLSARSKRKLEDSPPKPSTSSAIGRRRQKLEGKAVREIPQGHSHQHAYAVRGNDGDNDNSLPETILPVTELFSNPTAQGMTLALRDLRTALNSGDSALDTILKIKYSLQRVLREAVPVESTAGFSDPRTWAVILGKSARLLDAVKIIEGRFPNWNVAPIWEKLLERLPLQVGPNFASAGSQRASAYIRAASAVLYAFKKNRKPTQILLDIVRRPGDENDRNQYPTDFDWKWVRGQLTPDDIAIINSFPGYGKI